MMTAIVDFVMLIMIFTTAQTLYVALFQALDSLITVMVFNVQLMKIVFLGTVILIKLFVKMLFVIPLFLNLQISYAMVLIVRAIVIVSQIIVT